MNLDSGDQYSFLDSEKKPYIAKRRGDKLSFIQDRKITESIHEKEIKFTNKRNPRLEIVVTKSPDGRITNIENETGIRFPFSVDQLLQRNVEVWACNNNFLMDGKDTCPEKKIFGVKASDVPQGHEWRHIFPNKFK
jgi:hypothetical protein